MFNSSPITSWEGAEVFSTFGAGTFGAHLWFWIAVVCCIIPLVVSIRAENKAERDHK